MKKIRPFVALFYALFSLAATIFELGDIFIMGGLILSAIYINAKDEPTRQMV